MKDKLRREWMLGKTNNGVYMYCFSVVDMKSLEEIGRGFYIKKGKVDWKVFWDTKG